MGWLVVNKFLILLHFVTIFVFSFFITTSYLKKYIYRKIKLIYKSIHTSKLSNDKSKDIDTSKDILGEVEKEVSTWFEAHSKNSYKLEELENYRRNFLGNISHELKTPVFNAQGFIHTLLDGGWEDENIRLPYLQRAAKNIDRLQTIIEDLEVIARLESGATPLEIQNFDIKQLAEEVIEDLEITAKQKNIVLQLKDRTARKYKVNADRESIRQVFTNLMVNSIKYGKENGVTKIGFYDMENVLLIEVADNGIGILPKHLPHLYDRFYRVDKSRSRIEGGSGLGLSIVKHIIEAHKQTVNIRSTPGIGSTFGFTLEKTA